MGVIGANDTGPEFWCFLALALAYLGADVAARARKEPCRRRAARGRGARAIRRHQKITKTQT